MTDVRVTRGKNVLLEYQGQNPMDVFSYQEFAVSFRDAFK
jgi:hypothetical protein